jgi:acetate kinase
MTGPDTENSRVLVINCGSSSIKYQLLTSDGNMIAGGLLERIGEDPSLLRHRWHEQSGESAELQRAVVARDHREAFKHITAAMHECGMELGQMGLTAIGHRVVHGGEQFTQPTLISVEVIESIRELIPLAPLHNPANLLGIEACHQAFPEVPQVAVFDTAFHQTMPPMAYRYAVPDEWYSRHQVRRYGFHGSSHRYVADQAARFVGRPLERLNLITLHLGNGASAAAIANGRCVDTSMGFTPLEGLVMGTRCGDLDAAIPLHMQQVVGKSAERIDHVLNHESGLKALAGTNDMREILERQASGNPAAALALELYAYRIKKYIGAYFAALGSVDALIFTGGVGENAAPIRQLASQGLERLGIVLDPKANLAFRGTVGDIGQEGAPTRLLVVRTDEELQIAREALATVRGSNPGSSAS